MARLLPRCSPASLVAASLAALLVTLACGGDASGPGTTVVDGDVLPIGKTVTASLRLPATFLLRADSATEVAVFVRSTAASLVLQYSLAPGDTRTLTVEPEPAGSPFRQRTGRFVLAPGGTVRLSSTTTFPAPVPVEFWVYPVDRRPESVAATVAYGDTVTGEVLETNADVDEFVLSTPVAREVTAFLESQGGVLEATLLAPDGAALAAATAAAGPGSFLFQHRTPNVAVAAAVTHRVRVQMDSSVAAGAFRLLPYAVNPLPESLPAALAVGASTSGETLENPADVDSFTVTFPAPALAIGYLASPPGQATLQVRGLQPTPRLVRSTGGPDPESAATGRVTVAAASYAVVIRRDTAAAQAGLAAPLPYLARLRTIDRAPESVAPIIQPGDTTTGEAIDYVGDIDEFQVPSALGLVNAFIHAAPNALGEGVTLAADWQGVPLGRPARSQPGDTALADHRTGVFSIGQPTLRLTVAGASDTTLDRGAYRLFYYPIDPAPEHVPVSYTVGDSILGERIDFPGDVDTFSVTGLVGYESQARVDPAGAAAGLLRLEASSQYAGGFVPIAECPTGTPAQPCWSLREWIPRLRLSAPDTGAAYYGAYALHTYAFVVGPEVGDSALQLDSLRADSIAPPGDLDYYYFDADPEQWIELQLDAFQLKLRDLCCGWVMDSIVGGTPPGRIRLPGASPLRPFGDKYRVEVTHPAGISPAPGAYHLLMRRAPDTLETASAVLADGDSVTAEGFDFPGDLDTYTITGAPGDTMAISFPLLEWRDEVRAEVSFPGQAVPSFERTRRGTGRFILPASGTARLRIGEIGVGSYGTTFSRTGPYTVVVHKVNQAPEHVPGVFQRNSVIRGEAIDYEGDIDAWDYTAQAGDSLTLTISPTTYGVEDEDVTVPGYMWNGFGIWNNLGTSISGRNVTFTWYFPVTGTYRFFVKGSLDVAGTGGYELQVQ